jgi:SAM-dependent methyltransferase
MEKEPSYLWYTDYRDPASLKRLDFIVRGIMTLARLRGNSLKILELGCGVGNISFPLSSIGFDIIAVDIDPSIIFSCRTKNSFNNLDFVLGDAETLDLKRTFDVIICSEVLEHMSHPNLALKTLSNHLAPKGIAILTVPNGYNITELIINRFFGRRGKSLLIYKILGKSYKFITGTSNCPFSSPGPHVQFFSLNNIKKLLNENGFEIKTICHSDLGLPIPGVGRTKKLKEIECKFAEFVPHSFAGGWFFIINKESDKNALE